ncbi:MAG TPA: MEMO1 family protein [Candidatus Bathyarchaeia archaeon]|nr:MEMO1 family protein [Candidatus Bathyarchaeia archaeon]
MHKTITNLFVLYASYSAEVPLTMVVRMPSVAGSWYAGTPALLKKQIEDCFLHSIGVKRIPKVNLKGTRKIIGLVCPHAGYSYSGPVAANSYCALAEDGVPEVAVILGPNHTGMGSGLSIMVDGKWRTPLGEIEIDSAIAHRIANMSNIIDIDEKAHLSEHSLEMQIPFLQYLYGQNIRIVPICMMMQDLDSSRDVGKVLATSLEGKNAIIIASTDLSHYETYQRAFDKDSEAIREILRLDEEGLMRAVTQLNISMCGPGPVASCIIASRSLGANKATLLRYSTSADISGEMGAVVGYASIAIER